MGEHEGLTYDSPWIVAECCIVVGSIETVAYLMGDHLKVFKAGYYGGLPGVGAAQDGFVERGLSHQNIALGFTPLQSLLVFVLDGR